MALVSGFHVVLRVSNESRAPKPTGLGVLCAEIVKKRINKKTPQNITLNPKH